MRIDFVFFILLSFFFFFYCFYLVVVFFFFKQKTAYDMRISDWSSDVCSSDGCSSELVGWDGVLAPELQAIQLPAAQVLPELLLGIGHVAAQTACIPERGRWQRWFDCRHFAVPSPQPSPDGRGSQKRGLSSVVVGSGGLTVVISPYPHPSPLPEGEGAKGNSPRYSTPRFIWSRSMLSNRAWKLPSPKPSLPLRWMISKKIGPNAFVVKICSSLRWWVSGSASIRILFFASLGTSSPWLGTRWSITSK